MCIKLGLTKEAQKHNKKDVLCKLRSHIHESTDKNTQKEVLYSIVKNGHKSLKTAYPWSTSVLVNYVVYKQFGPLQPYPNLMVDPKTQPLLLLVQKEKPIIAYYS